MWSELQRARASSRRRNVGRYRAILNTCLAPLERAFVERRIAEERAELESLVRQVHGAVTHADDRASKSG